MRPNGLPVRALLLSDELGISGFTKPGGERLCSTHTNTHKSRGKVTEATTTRCRQDRRSAETPTERGCQPADHTDDVPTHMQ